MSNDDLLFKVTKENLETGLRGYPCGYCVTSTVDPDKGLFYGSYSIPQVASWEPERVIFLLYKGFDGSKEEIEKFSKELQKRAPLHSKTKEAIKKLPRESHPMTFFSAALLIAESFECKNDYREDALNLIAKIPEIAAIVINTHAGWGETPISRPEMGYMNNFEQMLNVPKRSKELAEVLKLFNILHYDHGGGNLSTFVGKAVASGLENMYGSIVAANLALAGPRHGGANQECLYFLNEATKALGETPNASDVEKFIRDKLAKKELIYGFGHAVLRVEDPRATIFYDFAKKHFSSHPLVKLALLMREEGSKVLKENSKVADPYPNVDAMSGTLLTAAGFPYPEYFTLLFGLSRAVGIALQIVYERLEARDGKGTPIVRPKYLFKPRVKK